MDHPEIDNILEWDSLSSTMDRSTSWDRGYIQERSLNFIIIGRMVVLINNGRCSPIPPYSSESVFCSPHINRLARVTGNDVDRLTLSQ